MTMTQDQIEALMQYVRAGELVSQVGDEAYKRWEYRSNFTQPIRQFTSNNEVPTKYAGSMIIYRKSAQQSQSV